MTKNQTGNALIVLLFVIVFAGLTGFIAWKALDSRPAESPASSQPQADPNDGYIVIKEWGVRFKPVDGLNLSDTQYFKAKTTSDSLFVTSKQLADTEPNCGEQTSQVAPLGLFSRSHKEDPQLGEVVAKIGEYSYQYRGSDTACSANSANYTLESNYRKLIGQSLTKLEASD
jgi:hypothetical protein